MDPIEKETPELGFLDRFGKSWFPPAAVMGAFAAFVAAAFRVRPAPKITPPPPARPGGFAPPAASPRAYARTYALTGVLGGATSAHPFRSSLSGVTVDSGGRIYALGDDEVRIFGGDGSFIRSWKVAEKAECLTAKSDGHVYVGVAGRVEIYDAAGVRAGGFAVGEAARPASITSVKICRGEILIADAAARLIRRFDASGRQVGVIGDRSKAGNFILPNKSLDIDVDSKGVILATDTGRHQVTRWSLDGAALGAFGKFGMSNPEDFVGCCNPVNLAAAPDGSIVTAEKMVARVKVFDPGGVLLALIGPENFDPGCIHIHLAVDSRGRILAADPVRREIKIFSPAVKTGKIESLDEEFKRA